MFSDVFIERTLNYLLFWGIWVLAPLLIDFTTGLVYFFSILFSKRTDRDSQQPLVFYPKVSIIIPVHNSADTLYHCLKSTYTQTYPLTQMQVICVNNGSEDDCFQVFHRFQGDYPDAMLSWVDINRSGKSVALNAGLYMSHGKYLLNVDSDAWLDSQAVENMVRAFESDPSLFAATGAIRIDKKPNGYHFMDIIHYCEVIEYLLAFDIGRRFQTMTNSLFTLSGAFSAFRSDVILQSFMYSERTVSEDTDLTFHIRKLSEEKKGRLGCVAGAAAYVEPIPSLARLYSQRLRWQRGEIEVAAMYTNIADNFWKGISSFSGRVLISDHTLTFSRLIWTFLIPFLYFLGYPLPLVVMCLIGLYVCYVILEILNFALAYRGVTGEFRGQLFKVWWVILFLPLFRYLVFWFRLAGIISAMTEVSSWRAENPFRQLRHAVVGNLNYLARFYKRVKERRKA